MPPRNDNDYFSMEVISLQDRQGTAHSFAWPKYFCLSSENVTNFRAVYTRSTYNNAQPADDEQRIINEHPIYTDVHKFQVQYHHEARKIVRKKRLTDAEALRAVNLFNDRPLRLPGTHQTPIPVDSKDGDVVFMGTVRRSQSRAAPTTPSTTRSTAASPSIADSSAARSADSRPRGRRRRDSAGSRPPVTRQSARISNRRRVANASGTGSSPLSHRNTGPVTIADDSGEEELVLPADDE
ncbi:hypothetical protein PT974_10001 [Cladobotryum mycophilum]|uniref:Uncharacterized protein n=1 Tax=Cladobotryum mycophilum TaxID=491253 RepID=A0ABR0S8M0_9HYPO